MVIAIGSEIALVSVPGEPFIESAQAIVSKSHFAHTLVSGYSNGGFGYIPTRSAFAEGGYETEATPFSQGAAEIMTDQILQLLKEMAEQEERV